MDELFFSKDEIRRARAHEDDAIRRKKLCIYGAGMVGAESLIRSQRPALAISIYHQMEHLWQIPAWIAGLGPDYRLHVLHHGPYHTDSVCCAV